MLDQGVKRKTGVSMASLGGILIHWRDQGSLLWSVTGPRVSLRGEHCCQSRSPHNGVAKADASFAAREVAKPCRLIVLPGHFVWWKFEAASQVTHWVFFFSLVGWGFFPHTPAPRLTVWSLSCYKTTAYFWKEIDTLFVLSLLFFFLLWFFIITIIIIIIIIILLILILLTLLLLLLLFSSSSSFRSFQFACPAVKISLPVWSSEWAWQVKSSQIGFLCPFFLYVIPLAHHQSGSTI